MDQLSMLAERTGSGPEVARRLRDLSRLGEDRVVDLRDADGAVEIASAALGRLNDRDGPRLAGGHVDGGDLVGRQTELRASSGA